ncbi:MAG: hypothetical protein A2Z83_03315 [Omnitrophica bacterium GWA2_52_8]|nr:MAG: hypothetical protein A2Z83_03315 [Omnitrophica bacterium GWA2_52_8]
MPNDQRNSRSLSNRISVRLVIPLFALATITVALQLTGQISAMNRVDIYKGQMAFKEYHLLLTEKLSRNSIKQFIQDLKSRTKSIRDIYDIAHLDILNIIRRQFVIDPVMPWTKTDYEFTEQSLFNLESGESYTIRTDKMNRLLIAYIPFYGLDQNQLFVARVVVQLTNLEEVLKKSMTHLALLLFFILMTGITIGRSLAKSIITPIKTLNEAAEELMRGNLGRHVQINTRDEIQTLAETFNHMSDRLREMKERAEDSNPLTGLPGNQGIYHELRKRTHERQKFVLFHADLDRFKIFNDHFGLARGDLAIKKTAELLSRVVVEKGSADDFVGHQGGDDFVILTRPKHAKEIAGHICQRFDAEILAALYRKEDLDNGYILELDRRNPVGPDGKEQLTKFPLLSITLAGISSAKQDYADYFDCMAAAVNVKKEAKKIPKSSYLIQE